jgi:carboxypeptidase Q
MTAMTRLLVFGFLLAALLPTRMCAEWKPLFDGSSLNGWTPTPFGGAGEVEVKDGQLVLNQGILTGITWTNSFPTNEYEIELEAQRVLGIDFFCGLTFPVNDTHLTLVLGGWGGSVVGLSNIDGESANQNETTSLQRFESGRWYGVRLRVASTNISVWLDREQVVNFDPRGRKLALRAGEIELNKPLGVATWSTAGALRKFRWRPLAEGAPAGGSGAALPAETVAAMESLVRAATNSHAAWDRLALLCDTFGPRPTGSTNLESALDWILARMKEDGLENVRGEPVKVPHWVRGEESAEMIAPRPERLPVLGLGGTIATPPGGVTAEVLVVTNFTELTNRAAEARGRIVLFNAPFTRYGETVRYRWAGASEAAKAGAVASLVRSVGDYSLRTPHTGAMGYDTNVARIPHAALASEDASRIGRLVARGQKVTLRLSLSAQTLPEADGRNIVAEIRGREHPEEIVVVGGHIDSWDVGQGAQDDGGGCVAAWEALRLMKKLGLRPRRTVRCVLWTGEENSGGGGRAYRDAHLGELDRHVLAIESDNGTFRPVGFGFVGSDAARGLLRPVHEFLGAALDAGKADNAGLEADTSHLLQKGVPVMAIHVPDGRYFRYHHTEADTVDAVDPDDLARCSAALAAMVYAVADMPERLPR